MNLLVELSDLLCGVLMFERIDRLDRDSDFLYISCLVKNLLEVLVRSLIAVMKSVRCSLSGKAAAACDKLVDESVLFGKHLKQAHLWAGYLGAWEEAVVMLLNLKTQPVAILSVISLSDFRLAFLRRRFRFTDLSYLQFLVIDWTS